MRRGVALAAALSVSATVTACGASAAKDTDASLDTTRAATTARADAKGSGPTVLFIGTSLTAGLGLDPAQAYTTLVQAKADSAGTPIRAINAGVSGETSAGALRRIDWVLRTPADIIVIETGANDGLRALPVAQARSNLASIVQHAHRDQPNARIMLVQMEAPPNLGPEYTTAFHDMYVDVARRYHVGLIPFLLNGVAGDPRLNQADGVHPNVAGERIVANNVFTALEPTIRAVSETARR